MSEIEVGDIVWLAVPAWEPIHGKGPFRVAKVFPNTIVVRNLDGSTPKGAINWEINPGLYLRHGSVRKDEFRSALEHAWENKHAKV